MTPRSVNKDDVHRLFLQAVMSRRHVAEGVARGIWKACNEAVSESNSELDLQHEDTLEEWNNFLNKLDDLLSPLGLSFDVYRDEETGKRYRTLKNEVNDECAQLATDYTPIEIAFFKAVIQQIILARNHTFSISSLAALREVSFLKGKGSSFTKSHAEFILRSFVARGWLKRSTRGWFSLGPRTLNELDVYLRDTYEGELIFCVVCEDVLTKGVKCPTPNCQACLHHHCYEEYKLSESRQQQQRKDKDNNGTILCPNCRQSRGWSDSESLLPVGEGAIKAGQAEKRRILRGDDKDDSEKEDSEEEEVEEHLSQYISQSEGQTQTQRKETQKKNRRSTLQSQGQGRKKGKERQDTSESEADEQEDTYEDDAMDIDNLIELQQKSYRSRR